MAHSAESPALRPARAEDAGAVATLYGHYVRTHTATFEIDPPDESTMAARMLEVLRADLPWWVAERSGRVVGYCYAGPYHRRPGYRFTLEDSVYVAPDCVGQGVGRALLSRVLAACEEWGGREVVAVVGDSANEPSIRLHESLGFTPVGTLRNVGFKFGRWLDTVILQRSLRGGAERA